jgi:branched-chain amino acid aminotransferase
MTYVGGSGSSDQNRPTVCVHTFPLPFELWARNYETGLHLVSVPTRSIPDDVIDPRIKHRSRLHWHLASRAARQVDPASMAILTDDRGHLTETATGNLCVVDGPTIITPAAHVLEGISREYVIELAASAGMGCVHADVNAADLANADEAFLTSTPHCLLPVTRFNCQPIGSGQVGPVYRQLIDAWSKSVGVDVVEQMRQGASGGSGH